MHPTSRLRWPHDGSTRSQGRRMSVDATPALREGSMLTVIVLAYNHETTLAAALDSILTQKTTYPYHIWLCEDRSTDRTLEVCADYAQRYPARLTLIAQPTNTGLLHLREALCKVTTPYLAILDGD